MKLTFPHCYPSYFLLLVILVYTPRLSYSQNDTPNDHFDFSRVWPGDSGLEVFDPDTYKDPCRSNHAKPQPRKELCYKNLAEKIKKWILYASNFKNIDKEIEYLYEIIPKTGEDEYNSQSYRDDIESLKRKGASSERKIKNSCTNVDLRDSLGPVRDQDSIGWCYAFTAADLLTHHTGKRVSAAALAMGYNDNASRGPKKNQ